MRGIIDCDGVMSNFAARMLDVVFRVTGRRYTPEQVTEFNFSKALGLSPADAAVVKHAISQPGFCAGLQPYPGAVAGVRRLRELVDVHVVTTRWHSNPTWAHEREAWLHEHFDIGFGRVHHAASKHVYAGDVFVDDKADHVADWAREWPGKLAVLWRTPHNRTEPLPPGARETSEWSTLISWVEALTVVNDRQLQLGGVG